MLPDHLVHIHTIFSLLTPKRAFVRCHTMCLSCKQVFCSCCNACIDCCRAKFGEAAFLEVYQKLYEAPDPATVLISTAVSIQAFQFKFTSHHMSLAQQPMQCWQHVLPTSPKRRDFMPMAAEQSSAACSTNTALPFLPSMHASKVLFARSKHIIACLVVTTE